MDDDGKVLESLCNTRVKPDELYEIASALVRRRSLEDAETTVKRLIKATSTVPC